LALSFFFKRKIFSFGSPLTLPFLFFVSWAFLGLFFALNKENSINDFYGHLVKYLAIYYILINFFNSRKLLVLLSWIIIISAALFSLGGMIYFYLILGNSLSTLFRIHTMTYGYFHFFLVLAFLLSIQILFGEVKPYHKIILVISLISSAMIILLSQTRSALVAIVIGLSFLFFKNKKIFYFLAIFVLGSFLLITSMSDRLTLNTIREHTDKRIGVTLLFIEMIKDYPLIGIGFGMQTYDDPKLLAKYNSKVPVKYRQEPPVPSPHNLLADVSVRVGFVGLGFFIYIIFVFVHTGWKMIRFGNDDFIRNWAHCLVSAFAAFFINGMAMDATFGIQAIVFYTLLAMMTILWRLNGAAESPICARPKRTS